MQEPGARVASAVAGGINNQWSQIVAAAAPQQVHCLEENWWPPHNDPYRWRAVTQNFRSMKSSWRASMFKPSVLLLLNMLVVGCATGPSQATFEAPAGRFHSEWANEPSAELTFSATMRLTSGAYGTKWPPGACVGIFEEPDTQLEQPNTGDSVQVCLVDYRPKESLFYVIYRLIRAGEEVQSESLLKVEPNVPVRVHLAFHQGTVRISVNDRSPVELNTHFKVVRRYATVSSGSAEINFAP